MLARREQARVHARWLAALLASAALSSACERRAGGGLETEAAAPAARAAAAAADTVAVTSRTREQMTTFVSITVAAPETPETLAAIEAGFTEVARLDVVLNEWRNDSEISAVSRAAGEHPVAVGEDVFANLDEAARIARASGGAFDPTVGALWGAWDFTWQQHRIPSRAELAARLVHVDYRKLTLDPARRTAYLREPGMRLAIGAIAKGYTADRVSAVLGARGFPSHLVAVGGEVVAAGRKGPKRWRVGVRHPSGTGLVGSLELEDQALSTSGNYERFFIEDGVRYHHILAPGTGQPARGVAAVTVLADRGMRADGLATAIFVLGRDAGLALARREGVEALVFAEDTYESFPTDGFAARLTRDLASTEATAGREPQSRPGVTP